MSKKNDMLARMQQRAATKPVTAPTPVDDTNVRTSIYLPKKLHRHVMIELKKADTTLSEAVRQALTDRFGEPE